jgi:uncharacterized protein (DUF58 family)
LKEIIIKSKKLSFTLFSGHRRSSRHSDGLNFKDLREYQIGDNVKRIDYKTTAKLQKPFIKEYEDEKELNIVFGVFIDNKSYFGTKKLKSELIAEVLATLNFSVIKSSDRFMNYIFSSNKFKTKPSKNSAFIHHSLEHLKSIELLKSKFDFETSLREILSSTQKNSVVILIGDFFYNSEVLKYLGKKFDTYAVIIRDKLEEDPTPINGLNIISTFSNKSSVANFNKSYRAKLLKNDSELFENLRKSGIKYMKLYTDDDLMKLRGLFA